MRPIPTSSCLGRAERLKFGVAIVPRRGLQPIWPCVVLQQRSYRLSVHARAAAGSGKGKPAVPKVVPPSTPTPASIPSGGQMNDDNHPVIGVTTKGGGLNRPCLMIHGEGLASVKGLSRFQPLREAALAANELYKRNGREPPNTPAIMQRLEEWLVRHPKGFVEKDEHPVVGVYKVSEGLYRPFLKAAGGKKVSTEGLGAHLPLRQAALAANELYERNGRPAPNTPAVLQAMEEWLARHPNEDIKRASPENHPVKGVARVAPGLYRPRLMLPNGKMASTAGLGARLPLRQAALAANELYARNGLPAPNTDQVMQELEEWLAKQPSGEDMSL